MKRIIMRIGSLLLDAVLVNAGIILAFFIRFQGALPTGGLRAYFVMAPYLTIIWIGSLYFLGFYRPRRYVPALYLFSRTVQAAVMATIVSILATYLYRSRAAALPSTIFFISCFVNILLLSGWRFSYRAATRPGIRKALIVGSGKEADAMHKFLRGKLNPRYDIISIDTDHPEHIANEVHRKEIDEVVIALPSTDYKKILDIILECHEAKVNFKLKPDLVDILMRRPSISYLEDLPLVDLSWEPISGWYGTLKRTTDILISATMLLLLFPVILVIAVAVKLDSTGPVFYKQERIGKNRKPFLLYKFRSMERDAEERSGPVLATQDDPRATRVGRILRRVGADEIPQLWCVLTGKMSLVGPRPERKVFIEDYPQLRLSVKPGLTGLAQVNAKPNLDREEKIKRDLYYVQNPSFILDLQILLKTVFLILRQLKRR